ncbi:hypothetical protein [Actinoplanes sp. NBRC 101535]|uniref:hypothetical protein n=1 Tax=Actinoplanes sp. NBRC 101535 TaxID=3032196 RepID=UPI0024A29BEF|nr:hypothetical protein [Actinoplanes sp. NBRC 101535]GLY08223.1 hypothetical protein Acsp01_86020 [Actinoplanes sp. NBRC 101535]
MIYRSSTVHHPVRAAIRRWWHRWGAPLTALTVLIALAAGTVAARPHLFPPVDRHETGGAILLGAAATWALITLVRWTRDGRR